MGNPLSPFMCNLFMNQLEKRMKQSTLFPRFWRRYVDDVIAIVKRDKLGEVFAFINAASEHLKFTVEEESNGCLPFLDLLVIRSGEIFEFDVFRRATNAERFITSDSFHHHSHKYEAFNSMIFRLVNLPLREVRFEKEWQYICRIAELNGFNQKDIEPILS